MKKQVSSIDLYYLTNELEILKNSRINKIYQPNKNTVIFSLYKTNEGKKILHIDIGKYIYIAEEKEEGSTLGFGLLLRKHLDGYFLTDIEQLEPERILKFTFKTKDNIKYLYIEFFGKGNIILCDKNNIIVYAFEQHDFRERSVRPKLKYTYPMMSYNLFNLNENDLILLLRNSKRDSLVTCLATELGLGGLYSEEICLLSNIDKHQNPSSIGEKQIKTILNSIKKILNKKIEAYVIFDESDNTLDFIPFDLVYYKDERYKRQKFSTFNEAINFFCSCFKEPKETEFDKKLKALQYIIEQQKQTIEQLKKERHELRQKGEAIYQNYQLIKEIIEEINRASKKYSWWEIKNRLKEHKIVKEVNEKERKVIVEV